MRQQYYLAALVGNLGDGGRYTFEPGRVADAAVLHRHVEIDAQQHALALHVDVIEGAEFVHVSASRSQEPKVPPSIRSGGFPSCLLVTCMPWRNANTINPTSKIPAGMTTQTGSAIARSSEQLPHRHGGV